MERSKELYMERFFNLLFFSFVILSFTSVTYANGKEEMANQQCAQYKFHVKNSAGVQSQNIAHANLDIYPQNTGVCAEPKPIIVPNLSPGKFGIEYNIQENTWSFEGMVVQCFWVSLLYGTMIWIQKKSHLIGPNRLLDI